MAPPTITESTGAYQTVTPVTLDFNTIPSSVPFDIDKTPTTSPGWTDV